MAFQNKKYFTKKLLEWYNPNSRPLPWKKEKNPYFIWLSEIILQQTRVEQGLKYYLKFKKNYPTVSHLAQAPEDEIMKNWEGLGYYSRARNLHSAAKYISSELDNQFPQTYSEILKLKGVGEYTAAAISSFAFNLPHAVVDGNVYRVLTRFFGIELAIDTTIGKKEIQQLAQELLYLKNPGLYNQAIMDFGATICKPKGAFCEKCLLQKKCKAFQNNMVAILPIKSKKIKKETRYFNYLIIHQNHQVYIRKRKEKDIWQNLYEFPLIETKKEISKASLLKQKNFFEIFFDQFYGILSFSDSYVQKLTHRTIIARFYEIEVNNSFKANKSDWVCVNKKDLRNFAFPKIIDLYIKKF